MLSKKIKNKTKVIHCMILFICHPGKGNIMGIKIQSVVAEGYDGEIVTVELNERRRL